MAAVMGASRDRPRSLPAGSDIAKRALVFGAGYHDGQTRRRLHAEERHICSIIEIMRSMERGMTADQMLTETPQHGAAEAFLKLLAIMAKLRDPAGGCPWDLAQSFRTIVPHTIEEA